MINKPTKNVKPDRLLQLGLVVALACTAPACASENKTGKHLFILSGQSNMTDTVRDAFTDRVQDYFGERNVVVVMRMKSGRGIRFWVADYGQPAGRGLTDNKMNSNGQEYKPLIKAVMAVAKDQSFDTVGFIWMQGESDANNRLSEVYEESFIKLIEQLEKDQGRDDLYFVIGRINDYARSRPDNEHWHRVRKSQVRLGNSKGNAWIDTDDLNDGKNRRGKDIKNDLHYSAEGYKTLGKRFAEACLIAIGK